MTASTSATNLDSDRGVSLGLVNDPDRLQSEVEALINEHKHIHPPEIAKLLDVPEAALVAASIGSGATRLVPEPTRVLANISNWGSVLCVFGSECGSFMPLGTIDSIESGGATVQLTGEHLDAEFDPKSIVDAYLLIEHDDMHGNTRSLQFFDGAGDPVVKVYIFHKTKFKEAKKMFDALVSDDQSRVLQVMSLADSAFDPQSVSRNADDDMEKLAQLNSKEILTAFLEEGGRFEIENLTRFGRAVWTGSLNKIRADDRMLHLHEEDIRAHLRFNAFKYWHYTKSGGLSASGDSGRLLRLAKLS